MAGCLLDTNLLLRVADAASPQHEAAKQAIGSLIAAGEQIVLTPQNFIEFWAVATRPISANGLGWPPEGTAVEIQEWQKRFLTVPDIPEIFEHWLHLVSAYRLIGKRVHDARLAAVMQAHRVPRLLTFNGPDFQIFQHITVIDPFAVNGLRS